MLIADNFVIDREGVLSGRRGLNRYGQQFSTSMNNTFEFQGKLVQHDGNRLKYDGGSGVWQTWNGFFDAPDASNRLRAVRERLSLFFCTASGVFKNDALTNHPVKAGMPPGLDCHASLSGIGGSWFNYDTQVSYRIVWSRTDANNVLLLGAPSFVEVISNPSTAVTWSRGGGGPYTITVTHTAHGYASSDIVEISSSSAATLNGSMTITVTNANTYTFSVSTDPGASGTANAGKNFNVRLDFSIPREDIKAGDSYRIYRSDLSSGVNDPPTDNHFKIAEGTVSAGDLAAGFIIYHDTNSDAFLDEQLDINTNLQDGGVLNANDRPPYCTDLATFRGYTWFCNIKREHSLIIQLIDVNGLVDDTSSITITGPAGSNTYTFSAAENIGTKKFKRFTSESTLAANVTKTAKSLCKVINRAASNSEITARYISGPNDAPGKVLLMHRRLNTNSFSLTCNNATTSTRFSPVIPTAGTSLSSKNGGRQNGLARSKFEQPEAVPLSNEEPVGSEEFPIRRILALKDSLIILTDAGFYKVSGDDENSFTIQLIASNTRILAYESAVVLNNFVFVMSNQGLVRANENDVGIVGRPIEKDFQQVQAFTNFATISYAIAYESYHKYILFTQDDAADTIPNIAWVYDYLTNTWTRWLKNVRCGHVLSTDDKLYLGHADDLYLLQERKSFNTSFTDFMDETLAITVSAVGTTTFRGDELSTVTFTYNYAGATMRPGWLFNQGSDEVLIISVSNVDSEYTAILDGLLPQLTTGPATISMPIKNEARWFPEAAGNPGLSKQFTAVQIYPEEDTASTHKLGFLSDRIPNLTYIDDYEMPIATGWGEGAWGEFGWGDDETAGATPLKVIVPRDYQRCRLLTLHYEHDVAQEPINILNVTYYYNVVGDRTVTVSETTGARN
jgi:hypothetical protein